MGELTRICGLGCRSGLHVSCVVGMTCLVLPQGSYRSAGPRSTFNSVQAFFPLWVCPNWPTSRCAAATLCSPYMGARLPLFVLWFAPCWPQETYPATAP